MLIENIQELCIANNTNFSKLEKELNFGNGTIRKWSYSSPSVDKLLKVAEYFETTLDKMLEQNEEDISVNGRQIARTYDTLSSEKQDLIRKYVNLLKTEERESA